MYSLDKMHITPEDYLARFEEYDDADFSYVDYFIRPYGPHLYNEMSDTHYKKDDIVPYHEHESGYETFLVDQGSVEVVINGKRTVVQKGDIIHIPPYTGHQFHFLEQDTIWRELFMEIQMNDGMLEHLRVKEYHRERLADPGYLSENHERHNSIWYEVQPEPEDVSAYEIPEIRTFESGLAEFHYAHMVLRQKVKRSEMKGVKEIWQMIMDAGCRISWDEENPYPKLYVVYSGSVKVEVDGQESFVAKERDIIHIPSFLAGNIQITENAVLLDYNCEGFLFRALTEIHALSVRNPETAADSDRVVDILRKYKCYMNFEFDAISVFTCTSRDFLYNRI